MLRTMHTKPDKVCYATLLLTKLAPEKLSAVPRDLTGKLWTESLNRIQASPRSRRRACNWRAEPGESAETVTWSD